MHSVAVPTDPKPSDAGVTGASTPPIGRYRRVPVQVHQADPDAPEVARRLIALIATRWPATPAEHVGSTAVPGLAGKNIIDLLLAAEPAHIPAITQALLELGFQPQVPAAFPATRPMLWGTFRHGAHRPTRSTSTWCRPTAPRWPPCAASGTPCAPTRSCAAAMRPSSGPSWPAARLDPVDLHQGQARLDRRHPGPSWPGGPPAAPPPPGRPGPGQVPPTGLMTHLPFSHACLFTGAANKGGLSGVCVVRTQDSITPFACPAISNGASVGAGERNRTGPVLLRRPRSERISGGRSARVGHTRAIRTRYREQADAPVWRGAATNHGSPRSTRPSITERAPSHGGGGLVADGVLVGRVAAVFRYPVKSMAAEPVEDVDVSWHGLSGDRRWAFVRPDLPSNGFPWLTLRERNDLNDYHPCWTEPARPDASAVIVRTPAGAAVGCHVAGPRG